MVRESLSRYGTATFWSFLHQSAWGELVARCLPHPAPASNNALSPRSKVFSFVQGLLCGAKKLTHVAYLRRDPMTPSLLGIKRGPSQPTLTRYFLSQLRCSLNQTLSRVTAYPRKCRKIAFRLHRYG